MTDAFQVDKTRLLITRLVALTAVIAITVYIYSIRDRAAEFEQYGYLGIFVISFMAYATVVLPAPGVAVVAAMGGVFNPFLVGLVAGLGAACGELVGYLAGYSGRGVAEKIKIYDQLVSFTRRFGAWGVLILSIIPNPFFDLAGLAAGTLKLSVYRFFLACWVGETAKMMVFAYGGATFLELLG
jgi:uncharacterized membrane protein YdjX (TVP38/TMEM64 family)